MPDSFQGFDPQNGQEYYDPNDIQKNRVICALSYLWILFFLPLVACPDSKYGRFHANQGLLLLIASVAGNCVFGIAKMIFRTLLPWFSFLINIVSSLYGILILGLVIYGIVNALNGRANPLPIIGKYTLIK